MERGTLTVVISAGVLARPAEQSLHVAALAAGGKNKHYELMTTSYCDTLQYIICNV